MYVPSAILACFDHMYLVKFECSHSLVHRGRHLQSATDQLKTIVLMPRRTEICAHRLRERAQLEMKPPSEFSRARVSRGVLVHFPLACAASHYRVCIMQTYCDSLLSHYLPAGRIASPTTRHFCKRCPGGIFLV